MRRSKALIEARNLLGSAAAIEQRGNSFCIGMAHGSGQYDDGPDNHRFWRDPMNFTSRRNGSARGTHLQKIASRFRSARSTSFALYASGRNWADALSQAIKKKNAG